MKGKLLVVVLMLLPLASFLAGCGAPAEGGVEDEGGLGGPAPSTPSATEVSDPLVQDAMSYAADQGIDLEEAIRRLQVQDMIGDLQPTLRMKEAETFAGLWIQHQPEFRVIVQFTRDGEETIPPYIEGAPWAGLVEVRQAALSLAELEAAQVEAVEAVAELDIPFDAGLNVMENRAELYVLDLAAFQSTLEEAGIQLPRGVVVIEVEALAMPE